MAPYLGVGDEEADHCRHDDNVRVFHQVDERVSPGLALLGVPAEAPEEVDRGDDYDEVPTGPVVSSRGALGGAERVRSVCGACAERVRSKGLVSKRIGWTERSE